MTTARPQAGETLNRVESTTRTNGRWSARASAVDVCDRRRSGAGSVVTARAMPPTSARVGVRTVGAAVPIGGVVPGSSTVSAAEPSRSFAVTSRRHAPGLGIVTAATYEIVSRPGGRTGIASTGAPLRAPVTETSCATGRSVGSSIRAPSADRVRMTGSGRPAQTDVETTSTPSAAAGELVCGGAPDGTVEDGAAVDGVDGGFDWFDGGVPSIVRRTAVIASDDVPNGNVARRIPEPSTRNTSAVCDIEYAPSPASASSRA